MRAMLLGIAIILFGGVIAVIGILLEELIFLGGMIAGLGLVVCIKAYRDGTLAFKKPMEKRQDDDNLDVY